MEKEKADHKRKQKVYKETVTCKIGDVYSVEPEFARTGVASGGIMRGRVIFIPKNRRFAVLEFQGIHGVSRECFWPEDLMAKCRA